MTTLVAVAVLVLGSRGGEGHVGVGERRGHHDRLLRADVEVLDGDLVADLGEHDGGADRRRDLVGVVDVVVDLDVPRLLATTDVSAESSDLAGHRGLLTALPRRVAVGPRRGRELDLVVLERRSLVVAERHVVGAGVVGIDEAQADEGGVGPRRAFGLVGDHPGQVTVDDVQGQTDGLVLVRLDVGRALPRSVLEGTDDGIFGAHGLARRVDPHVARVGVHDHDLVDRGVRVGRGEQHTPLRVGAAGVRQNGVARDLVTIGIAAAEALEVSLVVHAVPVDDVLGLVLAVDPIDPRRDLVHALAERVHSDLSIVGVDHQELEGHVERPAELRLERGHRVVGIPLVVDLQGRVVELEVKAVLVRVAVGLTTLADAESDGHGVLTVVVLDGTGVRVLGADLDVSGYDRVHATLVARAIEPQREDVDHLSGNHL